MLRKYLIESMTQYELAHKTAQRNAALPIEQGGLGLHPENTALERAKAMGFKGNYYRGSSFNNLPDNGVYLTGDIEYANKFAMADNGNTMRLLSRHSNPYSPSTQSYIEQIKLFPDEIDKLKTKGHDSVEWVHHGRMDRGKSGWGNDKSQFYVFEPNHIRSIHAAFDPMRQHESDLLA